MRLPGDLRGVSGYHRGFKRGFSEVKSDIRGASEASGAFQGLRVVAGLSPGLL